jgi:hypothetical protein
MEQRSGRRPMQDITMSMIISTSLCPVSLSYPSTSAFTCTGTDPFEDACTSLNTLPVSFCLMAVIPSLFPSTSLINTGIGAGTIGSLDHLVTVGSLRLSSGSSKHAANRVRFSARVHVEVFESHLHPDHHSGF